MGVFCCRSGGWWWVGSVRVSPVLLAALLAPVTSFAQQVRAELWPDKIWSQITNEIDRSGSQITNILFDAVDQNAITFLSTPDARFRGDYQRRVFDNQDVMRTWTVSDSIGFDLSGVLGRLSYSLVPGVMTPLNFNLGAGGRFQVTHIRQVASSKFLAAPEIDGIEELTRAKSRWWEYDPSVGPRFGRVWNPLMSIFRIPLSSKGLRKIGDGDLLSYSASGYVSVGMDAGLLPLTMIKDKLDLGASIGAQAFVRGDFRITILKEDARHVRVRLTRIRSKGFGGGIGAQGRSFEVYEGFMVFGNRLGQYKISVVPYNFRVEQQNSLQSDIGYRFDLGDPDAADAFEKALYGNFHFAGEIARENPAVELILTRKSKEHRVTRNRRVGLDGFFRGGTRREGKDLEVVLKGPDGDRLVFKSSYELTRDWSVFWGDGEKKDFLFTAVLDETALKKSQDKARKLAAESAAESATVSPEPQQQENSFQLVSEARIEDVRTSGKEMSGYIRDIKSVIGNEQALPDLPVLVPDEGGGEEVDARYGRASFYFGQFFSQSQVEKFINTSREKAREISLQSFSRIRNRILREAQAGKFLEHWMRLQEEFRKVSTRYDRLGFLNGLKSVFRYHSRSVDAMRAVLLSLDGEEIDYFITATNSSFGRIQYRGRATTNAERLLQLADETLGFENRVGRVQSNPNVVISDLKVEQLPDHSLRISFALPKDPKFLFFRVLRTSGWKKVKNLKEFIFHNQDRFKEGTNNWVIRPDSADPVESRLFQTFSDRDYYTLQMSVSTDHQSWGRVVSGRFRFVPVNASFEELSE
jgi:hypothetical protein